ncbi:hypothetical protein LPJ61_001474 [Coemansia biformis]|uniref:Uncharacterized protein n=1 Tax=Coemansia biformis TaxID=1286918 RepID=A0A9W7YFW6_9FUNG|nr:hypothetical protein LPJ61_001474 [Coemansia biformis]
MALNAVMLEEGTRHPVPLPNENFLYHCSGVKFELKSGDGYPGDAIALRSASGTAFVSNQRVVFLPDTTTHASSTASSPHGTLNSFTIPHASLKEQKFVQPMFGANRFEALALPVSGGAFPGCTALVLSFKDGGGFDFATVARKMSDRIQETGEAPPYEEELPVYDDGGALPGPAGPQDYPAEAPPGYEHQPAK